MNRAIILLKSLSLRNFLIGSMLCLLVAVVTIHAKTQVPLSPRELLKATRHRHGADEKPAYENISKETPKPPAPAPEPNDPPPAPEPNAPTLPPPTAVEEQPTKVVPKPTPPKSPPDQLLSMIPLQSQFCLRINAFEYTISQVDRFMAGLSPVPMGASMLVRMQLARVLGSSMLSGVNMNGNFAIFGPLDNKRPIGPDNIAFLVPVTDYKLFVSGNQNVSQPDSKGISTVTAEGLPPLSTAQVEQYVLVALKGNDNSLLAAAKALSNKKRSGLTKNLSPAQAKQAAKAPIWLYANVQRTAGTVLPKMLGKIQAFYMPAQPPGSDPAAAAMVPSDLSKQIRSATLAIKPSAQTLNLTLGILAQPQTELARVFKARSSAPLKPDSIASQVAYLIEAYKAGSAKITPDDIDELSKLIPSIDKADFVVKFSLGRLLGKAAAMSPMPIPPMNIQTKSEAVLAGRAQNGLMTVDIALPKKHLMEIAQAFQAMPPMMPGPMTPGHMPMSPPPTIEPKPTPPIAGTGQTVQGKIMDTSVVLPNATLKGNILSIFAGDSWGSNPSIQLFVFDIKEGTVLENLTFIVNPDNRISSSATIHVHYRWKDPESGKIETDSITSGYSLVLKFNNLTETGITGVLGLKVPEKKILLRGEFNARIIK